MTWQELIFDTAPQRIAVALLAAFAVVVITDRFSMPGPMRRSLLDRRLGLAAATADVLVRVVAVVWVYALFFAISWRPLYALVGVTSWFVIFTAISRAKLGFIREPLLFSDIALLADLFRHKELFYAGWLNIAFWVLAFGYVFGASAAFMVWEPSVLPAENGVAWITTVAALMLAMPLSLVFAPVRRRASVAVARLFGKQPIETMVARLGTYTALIAHFLLWLGRPAQRTPATTRERSDLQRALAPDASPLVVVWQSESFVDMRHLGRNDVALPNLDRLRARATDWGRLVNVFEGGYTLRTEFAVITGMEPARIGPDASHPYLRAGRYADQAWPTLFRDSGWSTDFVHPYDRRFFRRDKALPELGFERLTMLDDFAHHPATDGPYVTDMALSQRVLGLCGEGAQGAGQFVFVASMENHGPWKVGRHGMSESPTDIYCGILERSDAALGHLADALDSADRPVWLVFYGDHVPVLKSFADPFPDARTDYVIVPLGAARPTVQARRPQRELCAWTLLDRLALHLRDAGHPIAC